MAANLEEARALAPQLAALDGVAGVRWVENFVPRGPGREARRPCRPSGIGSARASSRTLPAPPPSDAELQDAFASARSSAEAIAATPEDAPIDAGIPPAGQRLADALDRFAAAQGTEPAALKALGEALTRQIPLIKADLVTKLSVTEPVTIDDIPPAFRSDWISSERKGAAPGPPRREHRLGCGHEGVHRARAVGGAGGRGRARQRHRRGPGDPALLRRGHRLHGDRDRSRRQRRQAPRSPTCFWCWRRLRWRRCGRSRPRRRSICRSTSPTSSSSRS